MLKPQISKASSIVSLSYQHLTLNAYLPLFFLPLPLLHPKPPLNKPINLPTRYHHHPITALPYPSIHPLESRPTASIFVFSVEAMTTRACPIAPSHRPFAILNLANINSISLDLDQRTAWIGAGDTIGQVYYRISEKSGVLGFPGGVCPPVGVGGHLSGGGLGFMMRKFGLASDNVVDAQLVNADGEILDRESMGEDLFWAIREEEEEGALVL